MDLTELFLDSIKFMYYLYLSIINIEHRTGQSLDDILTSKSIKMSHHFTIRKIIKMIDKSATKMDEFNLNFALQSLFLLFSEACLQYSDFYRDVATDTVASV